MKPVFVVLLLAALSLGGVRASSAQNSFARVDLVSDVSGRAATTDANLVNPWGLVPGPTGVFWVANQGSGTSTLYQPDGTKVALDVTIPGGSPTGVALASPADSAFEIPSADTTARALFVFVTTTGSISAWSPTLPTGTAVEVVGSSGAAYTGVAIANTPDGLRLYAANFATGAVDVFDRRFRPATLDPSDFDDPSIPEGYAPFNVANIGGRIYVAYAQREGDEEATGPGLGFVSEFETDGDFVRRFQSNGVLNAPWAMVVAPAGFGDFGGDLLIGNFGDGRIHAFDLASGALQSALRDTFGNDIELEGLWGLSFGAAASGADVAGRLYFAAGTDDETHGLFGYLVEADTTGEPGPGPGPGPGPTPTCFNAGGELSFWQSTCGRGRGHDPRDDDGGGDGDDPPGSGRGNPPWLGDGGPGFGRGNGNPPWLGDGGPGHGGPGNGGPGNGGPGNGNGPPAPSDSLPRLFACIDDRSAAFGPGGCFTAGCDLLQRRSGMTGEERLAQQLLVLYLNSCVGLTCDSLALDCDDLDEFDEFDDVHTVGDALAHLDAALCDDPSADDLERLNRLVACVNGLDDDHADHGDGGHGRGHVARGRIEVVPMSANPLSIGTGADARFQLRVETPSTVRFRIYDAAGRVVAEPLRDAAVSGPFEVRWDGRNLRGSLVPAGTYFYRATNGVQATTGRIVVVR